MTVEVRPMTGAAMADAREVLTGRRGRDACWCQRFVQHDAPDNQTAFEAEVRSASVPIGLLAYRDREPAGWSRIAPRSTLPGVTGNQALRRIFADDPFDGESAWWVACVVVRRAHRGHGVGIELVLAAVEFARQHGAAVVDGHPVDVERLAAKPSPAALFTGTVSMFEQAGFAEIGRTYPSRPVMRTMLR